MEKYVLKCLLCEREYKDNYFRLECSNKHEPSLLRSFYLKKKLEVDNRKPGMFKFYDFLPVKRILDVKGAPVTYKSEGLAHHLGIKNLYIVFNGYWPERNAFMETASFKELEAPPVLARVPKKSENTIVVASAGNTGRAFAHVCSKNRIPIILTVPETGVREIWSIEPFNENVKLLLASGDSDYYDAIALAEKVTRIDGFFPEGGAKNVARRDGMATTVLDATVTIGRIPDHYFQAIGSGTGGIAAWESCKRLIDDGSYGEGIMKLHLSQNFPFVPMVQAWKVGLGEIPPQDELEAKRKIRQIDAKVLSNRKPPYSIRGGVYDVMKDSSGFMYSVTNREASLSMEIFEKYEKIDICPAAGVAVGSLIQAVNKKTVNSEDFIVVNVTGGGEKRIKRDYNIHYLKPFMRVSDREIRDNQIEIKLEKIFARV